MKTKASTVCRPPKGTKLKRPRTKAFLERSSYHQSVQRSCAFLEREAELLCYDSPDNASDAVCNVMSDDSSSTSCITTNDASEIQSGCFDSLDDDDIDSSLLRTTAAPTDIMMVVNSVSKHRKRHRQEFVSYRGALKVEAQDNIKLFESFTYLSSAVDNARHSSVVSNNEGGDGSPKSCCPLMMLNQGFETTETIKNMIAEYAGVPSLSELDDWKELASYITIDESLDTM